MASPSAAFRVAQTAALRASATLPAAMDLDKARLYSVTPTNVPMPYVLTGEDQVLYEDEGLCAGEGEIFATVNWWSKPNPPDDQAQARAMGAAIVGALNAALAIDGHEVVVFDTQGETYATDPDGSTHGRCVFHYLTTAITA